MMKTITPIIVAFLLTGLGAGAAAAPSRPAIQQSPVTSLGTPIVAGSMRITPTAIVEDSRCPARVACVWPGRVVVRVTMSSLTAKLTRNMTVGETVSIGGKDVTLVAVTPGKTTTAIKPAAYRFRFTVQPGSTHI